MIIIAINTTNISSRNFLTFTNIIISMITSIGVKIQNIISLWLEVVIIQNNDKDKNTNNIILLLFSFDNTIIMNNWKININNINDLESDN